MAATYELIASNTLGSSAASVTFSSIPATYTDLVLRWSARTNLGAQTGQGYITLSGDTASNYSHRTVHGNGSTASSLNSSSLGYLRIQYAYTGADPTADVFANGELYIPNYTGSANKPLSVSVVTENNDTTAYAEANAGLWRNSSAVSSIKLEETFGSSFVSGSSFFLYGIKNS